MAESGMNREKGEVREGGEAYPNENCHKAVRNKVLGPYVSFWY